YQDRSVEQIIRSLRLKEEICVHGIVDQSNPIYQDAEISPLLNICQKALYIDTEQRYANVTDMRLALEEWLIREKERESARTLFQKAITLLTKADQKRHSANEKHARVQKFRTNTDPWIVDEHRQRTQAVLDSYYLEQHQADILSTEAVGIMRTLLENTPSFEPLSQRLVEELRRQHIQAETNGDTLIASSLWQQLQTIMHHLPDEHPEKRPLHNYLQGDGWFSLHTKPEGAELILERYIEQGLRLVPEQMGLIGESPIQKHPLPIGSFRLKIRKDGFDEVLYPIHISRNQYWDGLPPRGIGDASVYLPPKGSLQADEIYIPAGYFLHSSTPNQRHHVKTWLSGYVIQKYPVTNQQYLLFINWLLRYESEEAALRCAPQRNGHSLYERSTDGTFVLPEEERSSCRPVVCIDYHSVHNYALWLAKIDKKPWRLPSTLEWSKAAFGVDGRDFPWGGRSECAWANTCESSATPQLCSVNDFATDCSPYGVCGMAGNVRDLVLHTTDARTEISVCGGSWRTTLQYTHCRSTSLHRTSDRFEDVGFRLVYS
ncbi:MAG: SUMF1/EgtB/PvdO family nonheme iron enzyme, partial [Myxococcota bacterium]|nr:SUMF1/EgtB/PvdO family nonheme iron enzyme [Myxococcota bacterium]